MKRPAASASQQGLLLVEAVLAAVVIAVGIVFISRGLGSQVGALRTLEEYDTLLSLARTQLVALEGELRFGRLPSDVQQRSFEPPYEGYQWTVRATPLPEEPSNPTAVSMSRVRLTVTRATGSSRVLSLSAVWPTAAIPGAWSQ
ncbi:MAG: hypothetical protein HYZ91_02675 [Candidatus Omnitrophica bacterium]|nr:hypothetical protein [Candidatus Omnitrophota bacterium]